MIEVYLYVFVNSEQKNWVKLLLITKFAYNNAKNTSIGHISFKLNYSYHFCGFLEDEINLHLKSCSADIVAKELKDLIFIY